MNLLPNSFLLALLRFRQTISLSVMVTFPNNQLPMLALALRHLGDWRITCLEGWKQLKVTFKDSKTTWLGNKSLAGEKNDSVSLPGNSIIIYHLLERRMHFEDRIRLKLITDIKQCL
jgi:hypothetical protein